MVRGKFQGRGLVRSLYIDEARQLVRENENIQDCHRKLGGGRQQACSCLGVRYRQVTGLMSGWSRIAYRDQA